MTFQYLYSLGVTKQELKTFLKEYGFKALFTHYKDYTSGCISLTDFIEFIQYP